MIAWCGIMHVPEITLPITEPETEWVRGEALQKVSPTRSHSLLQAALAAELREWAGSRGEVGTEWRFRVTPPGEATRPLVPDISYVAVERLRGLTGTELEVPRLSPDVAVEILSPDDKRINVDDKIKTYLAAGSQLVVIVDPATRSIELHDKGGRRVLERDERLSHGELPGFTLSLTELFQVIDPPR